MNTLTMNPREKFLDFETFPVTAMPLSANQMQKAADLSSKIFNEEHQWKTYLNALALFGFENWISQRSNSLTINSDRTSIFQPEVANVIPAVSCLQVGDFQVCLIATGTLADRQVSLPQAVVELPEFMADFYVVVEVEEDREIAIVSSFISYQELSDRLTKGDLSATAEWNYEVPLVWFDNQPDILLLYLHCLEKAAISLPKTPTNRLSSLSKMQGELIKLLPRLQSGDRQLWQILTWEQAKAIITSPELLHWIYQNQLSTGSSRGSNPPLLHLADLLQLLTQPAINVGRWLQEELDDLAQQLSWVLLPNVPSGAMRSLNIDLSPGEEFQVIVTQIQQKGLEIPPDARGAYQDFQLGGMSLRLYAVTWAVISEPDPHYWTLLLILGAPVGAALPKNLKWRVSDRDSILVEQVLNSERGDAYLFTRVIGSWEEKFLVTVGLINGGELTLPAFTFTGFTPKL
jgi:hypothetical protein